VVSDNDKIHRTPHFRKKKKTKKTRVSPEKPWQPFKSSGVISREGSTGNFSTVPHIFGAPAAKVSASFRTGFCFCFSCQRCRQNQSCH